MNRQEIFDMRLQGMSFRDIATKVGLSRQRVQQLVSPSPAIKQFILTKYNGACSNCGILVGIGGHVHHKNTKTEDYNDIENLVLLCNSCHRRIHCEMSSINASDSGYLKVKEVMKRLGVTKATVHKWIKEGILPAKKIGGLYFIAESDFEKMLERGKK